MMIMEEEEELPVLTSRKLKVSQANKLLRRRKHGFRAIFRAAAFLSLLSGALLIRTFSNITAQQSVFLSNTDSHDENHFDKLFSRRLSSDTTNTDKIVDESCDDLVKVENKLYLVFYAAGVLYMFVAIAIVCDEFFVPALEEIASENYMNLSMDVAGATLMAAGGSAPELFTSLIGTFNKSEVGFGTIVGSAVFNVLFVIGMCAIFSNEILTLTWWPLARDCAYYSLGLAVLAVFCGYSSPGQIDLWEAFVLFVLYIGYVLVMKFNSRMYSWMKENVLTKKVSAAEGKSVEKEVVKPSTFRAGLLTMFMGKGSILENVGIAMVTKISGDVGTVFKKCDESGDGYIDKKEFYKLANSLSYTLSEEELNTAVEEVDLNHDGKIDLAEFTKWYMKSESRLRSELRATFDEFDTDKSGTIDASELRPLLTALGTEATDDGVHEFFRETCASNATNQVSYEEFEEWYIQSPHWIERKAKVDACTDDVVDPISDHLKPPSEGAILNYIRWALLLPIVFVLCSTVPDVRQPGKSKLCFLSFFLSIAWIGCFTYFMVTWTEVIGNTLGIPMILMGLTFLAAGTSVPDLLSSVIVARMGEGDMAVSSSIGSNIFDITVGLPVPWMLYIGTQKSVDSILIKTDGMEISIIILLAMLLSIVLMIHLSGWKMTKSLGVGMFLLYFLYLGQAIFRALPFTPCG